MAERKGKRGSEILEEVDVEECSFLMEPAKVEIGSGYTLQVSYDEDEKPVVDVKTYGQVNLAKLRKDIQKAYPDAHIRRLNEHQTITIIRPRAKKKPNAKRKLHQK